MATVRRTEAERRREVDGWRASGETVGAYAGRRGYSEWALRKWIAATRRPARPAGLVRVVPESAVAPTAEETLTVEVGPARIRVSRSFDAVLLRAVVSALSETTS